MAASMSRNKRRVPLSPRGCSCSDPGEPLPSLTHRLLPLAGDQRHAGRGLPQESGCRLELWQVQVRAMHLLQGPWVSSDKPFRAPGLHFLPCRRYRMMKTWMVASSEPLVLNISKILHLDCSRGSAASWHPVSDEQFEHANSHSHWTCILKARLAKGQLSYRKDLQHEHPPMETQRELASCSATNHIFTGFPLPIKQRCA